MVKEYKFLYKDLLKEYDKISLDNDQLNKVNEELNIMQTRTLEKVILLGREIHQLKGGQVVRRKIKTDK
jgi:hypothetical protein